MVKIMDREDLLDTLRDARELTSTHYTVIEAINPKLEVVGRIGFISPHREYFKFITTQGVVYEVDFDRVTNIYTSPKATRQQPQQVPEFKPEFSDKVPPNAPKMTRAEAELVFHNPPDAMTTELALLREEMPWFDQFLNTKIGCETIDTTHPNMPILRPCEIPLDHPNASTCRLCVKRRDIYPYDISQNYEEWEPKELIRAFHEIEEDIVGNLGLMQEHPDQSKGMAINDWLGQRWEISKALVLDDRDFLFRDKQGDVLQALRSYLRNEIDRMLGL